MTDFETYNELMKLYTKSLGKSSEEAQQMVFKHMGITEPPMVKELDWKTTIEVTEQYASQQANVVDALIKLLKDPYPHKRLIAPTGIGKTFLISMVLKAMGEKGMVIVPNIVTTKNLENDLGEGVVACHGDNKVKTVLKDPFIKFHMLACTVDRCREVQGILRQVENIYLIEDEAHAYPKMANFRDNAILSLEKAKRRRVFKGYLDVTATPSILTVDDKRYKTLELIQTRPKTMYNLHEVHYSKNSDNKKQEVINYIKKLKGKKVIYVNSKTTQEIFNRVSGWKYINAELKDCKIYRSITETNMIPKDVDTLVTTSLFTAGSSLKNPDIAHVVFIGVTDRDEVKQFSARFRNVTELDVHVIDSFQGDGTDPQIFKWVTDKDIKKTIKQLNNNEKNTETLHKHGFINGLFYYDEFEDKVMLSNYAYRNLLYDNILRANKIGCFNEFERNVIKNSDTIVLEKTGDLTYKTEKEKLKIEKELELKELNSKLFKIVEENYESLMTGSYIIELEREPTKVLEKIVNIMQEVNLGLEEWELLFRIATDKSFEHELKYRSTVNSIKRSGVRLDEMVHWCSLRTVNTIVSKDDIGKKNEYLWARVKQILRSLFVTADVRDGRNLLLHLVSRKKPLGEEYDPRIEMELRTYFLGFIKEDRLELEERATELTREVLDVFEGELVG